MAVDAIDQHHHLCGVLASDVARVPRVSGDGTLRVHRLHADGGVCLRLRFMDASGLRPLSALS